MNEEAGNSFNLDDLSGLEAFLQQNAQSRYRKITSSLPELVSRYEGRLQAEGSVPSDLGSLKTDLLQEIRRLREAMNRTKQPDIASALSAFEVEKNNGEKYTVNEGLEERANHHYKNTIAALEDLVRVVEDKIESGSRLEGSSTRTNIKKQGKGNKPNYLGYALMHHLWYKHSKDESKAITENTKRRWSRDNKLKEGELWKKVKELREINYTPSSNHNSVRAFANQYGLIIPRLKEVCEPAAKEAERALNQLKRQYPSYFH